MRKPSTAGEQSTTQSQSRISDAGPDSYSDANTEIDSKMPSESSSVQLSQPKDEEIYGMNKWAL